MDKEGGRQVRGMEGMGKKLECGKGVQEWGRWENP